LGLVNLEINGQQIQADAEATVMQAAQLAGIEVPHLCYDDGLSPYGACRLCVVEVEGGWGALPASCVTPVREGMKVFTESTAVIEHRKTILELLIANHPLDCMTCEKMGDCRLSDYCYKYGIKASAFSGMEQHCYLPDSSNPFIERDLNKCIQCGACVRACCEIPGVDNLSFGNRGFDRKVVTAGDSDYVNSDCTFCGTCVAVCPTGALQEKSLIGRGRRYEMTKVKTTCPFCGTGCNFDLVVKSGEIVGAMPNKSSVVNEIALCVKGRFGWDYVNSDKRLKTPLIRKNGKFEEVSWDEAYSTIASRLTDIKDRFGSDAFSALSSARCTNEENYLMQKFTRGVMGTNNIDHCART